MTSSTHTMEAPARVLAAPRRESWVRTQLAHRQLFSRFIFEGEALRIRVVSGHLWATFEGSPEDHHLSAGDARHFRGPGLLVAEGIEQGAVFEIA